MTDRGSRASAPGAGVPVDLAAVVTALGSIEATVVDDAARTDLITLLETLSCAATGAQAALAVDLRASQVAAQAAAGTPAARRWWVSRGGSRCTAARSTSGWPSWWSATCPT